MTEHKHAWVLRELADGASIDDYEIRFPKDTPLAFWHQLSQATSLLIEERGEIRRKPKMIRIGDVEFPEPVREPLVDGTEYFVSSLTSESLCHEYEWYNGIVANRSLQRGLVHLTKDAAQQHAKALILLSGGGV